MRNTMIERENLLKSEKIRNFHEKDKVNEKKINPGTI